MIGHGYQLSIVVDYYKRLIIIIIIDGWLLATIDQGYYWILANY